MIGCFFCFLFSPLDISGRKCRPFPLIHQWPIALCMLAIPPRAPRKKTIRNGGIQARTMSAKGREESCPLQVHRTQPLAPPRYYSGKVFRIRPLKCRRSWRGRELDTADFDRPIQLILFWTFRRQDWLPLWYQCLRRLPLWSNPVNSYGFRVPSGPHIFEWSKNFHNANCCHCILLSVPTWFRKTTPASLSSATAGRGNKTPAGEQATHAHFSFLATRQFMAAVHSKIPFKEI